MNSENRKSHRHSTDQHDDSYIKTGVKRLVASGGAYQARGGAHRAEREIDLFHSSAGKEQEPEQNAGNDGEDAAQNPCSSGYCRWYPDTGDRVGGYHLSRGNKKEHHRVHQGNHGAFTVGKNREAAHA